MKTIRVVVHGAVGKMGREVARAVYSETDMKVVGAVDLAAKEDHLVLPDGSGTVPFSSNLTDILASCQPDVVVDFSIALATMPVVRAAAERGVNLVIGTTGLSATDLEEIDRLAKAHQVGAIVAPNFTLGAILLAHFAKIASKYLNHAEIIELHHDQKVDAPSGTALSIARGMASARGKPFVSPSEKAFASRGQALEGISIHSVRLPGLMAHHEIIFGGPGQTLSLRHDTISRECYMPGVLLAIRDVGQHKGLVYGLDRLLDL